MERLQKSCTRWGETPSSPHLHAPEGAFSLPLPLGGEGWGAGAHSKYLSPTTCLSVWSANQVSGLLCLSTPPAVGPYLPDATGSIPVAAYPTAVQTNAALFLMATNESPASVNATIRTGRCSPSSRNVATSCRDTTSQSFTVPSPLPTAKRRLSGEKVSEWTPSN